MARFIMQTSLIALLTLLVSACGQSITEVTIEPREPTEDVDVVDPFIPFNYITSMDSQGGSATSTASPNRVMSIQSFGGNSVRTYSSSPSFKMTSGIGID